MTLSGKGGTGKSMFAVNLASTLAISGKKTLLIDMDIGLRTLDLYLGVQNETVFDLSDILNGLCTSEKAIVKAEPSDKLFVIAACQSRDDTAVSEDSLSSFLSEINREYDYIIFDCPPGLGHIIDACSRFSDLAILVINPNYVSVRDAEAAEDLLIRSGLMNRRYVLNRIAPYLAEIGAEMEPEQVDARLKCGMIGMIPEDDNIRASTNAGIPIVAKRDTYISRNFDRIADRIDEIEYI